MDKQFIINRIMLKLKSQNNYRGGGNSSGIKLVEGEDNIIYVSCNKDTTEKDKILNLKLVQIIAKKLDFNEVTFSLYPERNFPSNGVLDKQLREEYMI